MNVLHYQFRTINNGNFYLVWKPEFSCVSQHWDYAVVVGVYIESILGPTTRSVESITKLTASLVYGSGVDCTNKDKED